MNSTTVTVVIPCRNEKDYILQCVQSVLHNNYPREKIEVIVCDGMSDDGTFELLKNFAVKIPQLKVLVNEKRTTPYALNLGIKNSKGDVIIILGAHAEMHGNYLNTCVNILKEKPDVWCCGGILNNEAKDETGEIISVAMTSPFGVGSAHFRTGAREGYVDTVAFGAYRKEVFSLIGLFDEELTRNQDDEFNYRLTKAGKKIWLATDTSIKYFVRGSW
ncbi:MAG: glycosyltransferase family 2 protein, partial [Bacteroidota bacterium]